MRTIFVITILYLGTATITGCKTSSKFFNNHILIYSYEDAEFGVDSNYQFVDFYKDTLHWVSWTYVGGSFTFDSAHAKQIAGKYDLYPPFEEFSTRLTKHRNTISIGYQQKELKLTRKIFSLITNDTIRNTNDLLAPCDVIGPDNYTVYKGDTIILFNSNKLRCWKFEEFYLNGPVIDYSGNYIRRIVYLEQKTLLPIRIENTWYKYSKDGPGDVDGMPYTLKLGFVIKRDSVPRWLPRDCY